MLQQFLINFINIAFNLLSFAIIARVLLSWVSGARNGKFYEVLYSVTEPILGPFRRIIPRIGMIDISPIVAIIVVGFVQDILLRLLL